jgi:hypothetical protein
MSESQSIQVAVDNSTENYEVYESADGDTIVGMYVSSGAADSIGEFGEVSVSDSAEVEATLDKTTTNYGVFSTSGGAISGMYVSHELLSELFDEYDADESVDSIGLTISPSDEDSFEESAGVDEAEEEALVADGDSEEEEVDISDEEVGLVDE